MKYINQVDYVLGTRPQRKHECNTKPSMFIPNQAMTVREMLERFVRGQSVMGKQVYYDGVEDFEPDVTLDPAFDLSDATMITNQIRSNRQTMKELEKVAQKASEASVQAKPEEGGEKSVQA